jgi:hypothetical protein
VGLFIFGKHIIPLTKGICMRPDYERIVIEKTENFYREQIAIFNSYNLESFHKKYNPVLFLLIGHDLKTAVDKFVAAKIQASMETKVGHLYEQIAIEISGGKPETWIDGIDGDIRRIIEGKKYRFLVSIKSGSLWANANAAKAQKIHFNEAKKLREEPDTIVLTMMGICVGYGKAGPRQSRGIDVQLEGDDFWHFITGERNFYHDMTYLINEISIRMGGELAKAEDNAKHRIFSEIKYETKDEFVRSSHFKKEMKRKKQKDEFIAKLIESPKIESPKNETFEEDYTETTTRQMDFYF